MMGLMKRLVVLLSVSGALLCAQDLANVHSVYLMPMGHGLDQFLANRLTHEHVFQVVTTLKGADAVFTDRIGETFEENLAELQANANPKPVKPPTENDKSSKQPDSDQSAKQADTNPAAKESAIDALAKAPAVVSTFGQAKGTVFLVDPKSHRVLWSAYRPAKSSNSDDLDRTASDIVSRLQHDLKTK